MKKSQKAGLALLLAAFLILLAAVFLLWQGRQVPNTPPVPTAAASPSPVNSPSASPRPTPSPTPTVSVSPDPAIEDDGLPHDKLFITVERQAYKDGDLSLQIPKLNVNVPVLNGVDAKTLLKGIGLYDYAQLPGEGDRNVSIAGHRNGLRNGKITDNMPFYYIDTLAEGDYLYLTDSEHIYQYDYDSTEVVEPDDWGPIYSQGFSCLTLTSCTPIGVADHRIIVRGRLAQILPLSDDYEYPVSREEDTNGNEISD